MSKKKIFFGSRGLVKRYHDVTHVVTALNGATLEVDQGEMIAVVGRSGSGKSTLLHVLGLLDTPDSGSVIYQGEELNGLSERARDGMRNRTFGFVFQSYHLLPEFSALENLLMPSMMCPAGVWRGRRAEATRFARELLERVELADRADHRPAQLSGGEQQRVAIARALVNRPPILLCDEPTGNLDSETSDAIHDLLRSIVRDQGTTAVIVTHDVALARMADRVLSIESGRLSPHSVGEA